MAFDSLMVHTCSVVQAGTKTAGYGHGGAPDWATPTATTSGVPCRLRRLSARERVETGLAGTVVADHVLDVAIGEAPASLRAAGAETRHRIINVAWRDGGDSVDAGPFDVLQIIDAAGAGHHLALELRRVA